jgi:hypothetical protein
MWHNLLIAETLRFLLWRQFYIFLFSSSLLHQHHHLRLVANEWIEMLLRVKISDFIFFGAIEFKWRRKRKHERIFFSSLFAERTEIFWQSFISHVHNGVCMRNFYFQFNKHIIISISVCKIYIIMTLRHIIFVGETFKVVAFSISQLTRDTCLRLTKRQQLKLNKYARNDNINFHLPHQFSRTHSHSWTDWLRLNKHDDLNMSEMWDNEDARLGIVFRLLWKTRFCEWCCWLAKTTKNMSHVAN